MKELDDEELQRMMGDGYLPANEPLSDDAKVYKTLFEALRKEPEAGLPYDFAAKVTRQISTQQERSSELKYNLVACAVFIGLIIVACVALTVSGSIKWNDVSKYKWILLLVPIAFIMIQYFDQKLVKTRIFNNRSYKP